MKKIIKEGNVRTLYKQWEYECPSCGAVFQYEGDTPQLVLTCPCCGLPINVAISNTTALITAINLRRIADVLEKEDK